MFLFLPLIFRVKLVQKVKGLNLRRKVSQFKIVMKIKILDNLETLFFILLKSSFFVGKQEIFHDTVYYDLHTW